MKPNLNRLAKCLQHLEGTLLSMNTDSLSLAVQPDFKSLLIIVEEDELHLHYNGHSDRVPNNPNTVCHYVRMFLQRHSSWHIARIPKTPEEIHFIRL